eukprot:1214842-Pyramimonas_sp.AAC.1
MAGIDGVSGEGPTSTSSTPLSNSVAASLGEGEATYPPTVSPAPPLRPEGRSIPSGVGRRIMKGKITGMGKHFTSDASSRST